MDIQPATILAMVDHIVEAEEPEDVQATVAGMRLKLKGVVPSLVLQKLAIPEHDPLQARLDELSKQVSALMTENAELERKIETLSAMLVQECAIDGFYTMDQFMAVLLSKLKGSYAWRTRYINATQGSPDCRPVANETIQKWRAMNRVPDWAVDQITRLTFAQRKGNAGPTWTANENLFLAETYRNDPTQTNVALAVKCSERFGRNITENSIKGKVDRLRKSAVIHYRKSKHTD